MVVSQQDHTPNISACTHATPETRQSLTPGQTPTKPTTTIEDARTKRRNHLTNLAAYTLLILERGKYALGRDTVDIQYQIDQCTRRTRLYGSEHLAAWVSPYRASSRGQCHILMEKMTSLQGARYMANGLARGGTVGVLNFASATSPGGGFLNGAEAQEESLARSSTLYPSLKRGSGSDFYYNNKRDPHDGFYSHAMIYSPGVVLFRNDNGDLRAPVLVDVLSSCAVDAGVVRKKRGSDTRLEMKIMETMRERMARILHLFEMRKVRHIVLGSFGTGCYRNDIRAVAYYWADFLGWERSRFGRSFDNVLFAIPDARTYDSFTRHYNDRVHANRAAAKSNRMWSS